MTKRYVYTNQKGGCTKTTTAINAAVMGGLCGKRTLLVDMDGQGNSTWAMGYSPDYLEHTVYTVMQGTSTLQQALKPTYFDPKTGIFFDPGDTRTMRPSVLQRSGRRGGVLTCCPIISWPGAPTASCRITPPGASSCAISSQSSMHATTRSTWTPIPAWGK